jgi:hypothetical protein
MKSMNKKEGLCIVISFIGVLVLASSLLHDYLDGNVINYGLYDKVGIIVGAALAVIGLLLFIRLLSVRANIFKILIVVILVALPAIACGFSYGYYLSGQDSQEKISDRGGTWAIGTYKSSSSEPFDFSGVNVSNPVLTARDVTDIPAEFVADPSLIRRNNAYYMFFEVMNNNTMQGDIGLAISNDGFNWTYKQIILDEDFHLSYPYVFKWNNEYYMIPEGSSQKDSIRLYKSKDFPYNWSFVKNLVQGTYFVDTSIFRYNNTWWIFTGSCNNDVLWLYYSDNLTGPWIEHPESPIINGDANISRPGGRVIVFDNDRIVRYTQDCDPYYGNQVWAFEITTLTKKSYEEHRVGRTPILKGFDNWNTRGMHQISPCQVNGNGWIASVDGY